MWLPFHFDNDNLWATAHSSVTPSGSRSGPDFSGDLGEFWVKRDIVGRVIGC
jgi:hypothetical protein